MSEISEGEEVITPEGEVDQVVRVTEIQDPCGPQVWLKERELGLGQDKLVKTSEPIRVKVSREKQAEDLVALAEENYFVKAFCGDQLFPQYYKICPDTERIKLIGGGGQNGDYDLTFESDYQQVKAWLTYHGESEDECETCHDNEFIHRGNGPEDCPDCTDDSSEPRPEDEEGTPESRLNELSKFTQEKVDGYSGFEARPFELFLMDYIDDLESELESVREERDRYIKELGNRDATIQLLQNEIDNAQERIEEAREEINLGIDETRKDEPHLDTIRGHFAKAGDILSPDSDEGDCE